MSVILLIVVGGVLGWLASIVTHTEARQGILLEVAAGIAGAVVAGLLVSPLVGGGNVASGHYSLTALVVSFLGAAIVLVIFNLFHRGSMR